MLQVCGKRAQNQSSDLKHFIEHLLIHATRQVGDATMSTNGTPDGATACHKTWHGPQRCLEVHTLWELPVQRILEELQSHGCLATHSGFLLRPLLLSYRNMGEFRVTQEGDLRQTALFQVTCVLHEVHAAQDLKVDGEAESQA
eukprot:4287819-Amphidinium_carterae.1